MKKGTKSRKKMPARKRAARSSSPRNDEVFRLVSRHIDDLVAIIDRRGRRIYASPSYAAALRDPHGEKSSDAFREIHPEDRERIHRVCDESLRSGRGGKAEYRFLLPDGTVRFIRSKICVLNDKRGLLVVSRDVTEQQEAEKRQRLLAYALSCTKDCFCLTDLENNFLFVNPAFCETYGYTEAELVGKNITMIRSSDTPEEIVNQIVPKTLEGGWYGEILNRRKDGTRIRVELWTSVVRDEEGTPVALVGVARDITARKYAEEEIRLLHAITQTMNEATDVQSALGIAVRKICDFTQWMMGQAWIQNAEGTKLNCAVAYFKPNPALHQFHRLSKAHALGPGVGLPGKVWIEKQPVWITDLASSNDSPFSDLTRGAGFRSAVGIPILAHGKVVAVVEFYMAESLEMDDQLADLVSTLGMQLGSVVQRKQAEEALQQTIALVTSTLESTGDGILVVNAAGKVVTFNKKFVTMWRIPQSLLEFRDDTKLINFVLDQLKSPDRFVDKIKELYADADSESFDLIEFKDGRVFERFSMPQRINGKSEGRVWSFHDITERKRIEQRLIEGETKYRLLFESNPEAMWVYDAETLRFLAVNEAAVVRYGYTEEEFLSMTTTDLLVSPAQSRSAQPRLPESQPQTWFHQRRKDGTVIDVEFLAHPIEFSGRMAQMVIAKDVTGRRRAEKVQEAVYRIAQASDASQTLDELYEAVHGIIKTVMPADNFYIALYDEKEDILSFPYFVDEVDAPAPPRKLGRGLTEHVLRTGHSLLCDYKLDEEMQRRGEVEMVGVSSSIWLGVPLILEHKAIGVMTVQHYADPAAYGEPEKQVLEFVSSQIARAIDKKRAEEALRLSEGKYRTLFEESKDGIFMSTPEGKLIDVNPAGVELFGYTSREEMLRTDIAHDLYYNPGDRDLFIRKLAAQGFIVDFEFEIKTKSGERRVVLESATAITNHLNKIVAYRGFLRDITERKKLEEQLRHAQKMESIGTLAGGIAHDFNNLLGIILGYTSLLETEYGDRTKAAQNIHTVKKAVERGAGLVRQLLTFARKSESWFEPLNVNDTVKELAKMLMQTFPKTIAISTNLQQVLPFIVADSGQIHQAILNLCVNARDAIIGEQAESNAAGQVTVSTAVVERASIQSKFSDLTAKEYVVISVSDTGVGMSEETRHRIFEPFFTTKGLGRGTGLGLSVVYGVVNNHRGCIDVESALGVGTTFYLYFPAQTPLLDIDAEPAVPAFKARGGKETILVVEDEEMLLKLVQTVLEDRGYRVLTAKDGQEGIDIFRNRHEEIACILTDMGLPRLGGWEMFLKMKEVKPTVKAILASGYCDPKIRAEMMKEGAKDFIQKPYVSEVVLQRIREILDAD